MLCGCMMGGMAAAWIWAVFSLVLLAVAVLGVIWLLRAVTGPGHRRRDGSASAELDLRYARGQLDREDYLQRRADLEDDLEGANP
jgi:putative membrane protein